MSKQEQIRKWDKLISMKGFVFLHEDGELYTKQDLRMFMRTFYRLKMYDRYDIEKLEDKLADRLTPIENKPFLREDKPHSLLCEYAKEDECECWCRQKYQQMRCITESSRGKDRHES